MERLDIYDEKGNFLGTEERSVVHTKGLWHKTVHCWLYDKMGNVFFQIRKEEQTLYTTASGHLSAGESVQEGFAREIKEEIGIDIDDAAATLVSVVPFVMDREKKDGTFFRDRAFANVYVDEYEGDYQDFCFDKDEVSGLVKVSSKDALQLFSQGQGSILGLVITMNETGQISTEEKEIYFDDFLVNPHETALGKYGEILKKVIELTQE